MVRADRSKSPFGSAWTIETSTKRAKNSTNVDLAHRFIPDAVHKAAEQGRMEGLFAVDPLTPDEPPENARDS